MEISNVFSIGELASKGGSDFLLFFIILSSNFSSILSFVVVSVALSSGVLVMFLPKLSEISVISGNWGKTSYDNLKIIGILSEVFVLVKLFLFA